MHMSHQRWGLGYGLVFSLALERTADSQMFFQSQQTSSHLCKPNPNASTMCIDFRSAALTPLTRVWGQAVFAHVQQLQVPYVLCRRAAAIKNLSNTQSHEKGGREPARKYGYFFLFLNSSLIHGNPAHPVELRTSSVPSTACSNVHGSFPNQSIFDLWTWGSVSGTVWTPTGRWECGVGGPLLKELGQHCCH